MPPSMALLLSQPLAQALPAPRSFAFTGGGGRGGDGGFAACRGRGAGGGGRSGSTSRETTSVAEVSSPTSVASSRPSMMSADSDELNTRLATLGLGSAHLELPDVEEDWRMGLRLEGCFGTVHRAMDQASGALFAVRILRAPAPSLARGTVRDGGSGKPAGCVLEDVMVWRSLRHPNLLALLKYTSAGDRLFLHLEVPPHGCLAHFLADFGPVDGLLLRRSSRELLEAVSFLHSQQVPIAHGNIRAASLFVTGASHIKLAASFGGAELCGDRTVTAAVAADQALPWAAPEVVRAGADVLTVDRLKADMWSIGCTILEMATAELPWGHAMRPETLLATLKGPFAIVPKMPMLMPTGGRDLCSRCLQWSPPQRPSAMELLAHTFVAHDSVGTEGVDE